MSMQSRYLLNSRPHLSVPFRLRELDDVCIRVWIQFAFAVAVFHGEFLEAASRRITMAQQGAQVELVSVTTTTAAPWNTFD